MKNTLILLGFLSVNIVYGQNLYPEKFDSCELERFCLDCGDTKAQPPKSFLGDFVSNLNKKAFKKIKGDIEVQLLIDELGNPCLLSAKNNTNIESKKLKLQNGFNNTAKWSPAMSNGNPEQVSVSLLLSFNNKQISIQRLAFNSNNFKNDGSQDEEKHIDKELSESWELFTRDNSDLPSNRSDGLAVDRNGVIWFGTNNGLVRMENGQMKVFNTQNSSLKPEKYNKNATSSIREIAADHENNIWLIANWNVYNYDGENWTVYDSTNSPIVWARRIFVDKSNNVWFTSWDGVSKYDGNSWSVMDTSNSQLPTNKVLGFFIDSKERIWIGTFEGNIRIDNSETVDFAGDNSPLGEANISMMFEDKKGNLWFDLHNYNDMTKGGMYVLKPNGEWITIKPNNSDPFKENTINDFLLDEESNILWIALNHIGILKYDILNDSWETYTSKNSNVPSKYVMQFEQEEDGTIWAVTFGGIIKLNKK